jgi:AraC-like DNA-binding protein
MDFKIIAPGGNELQIIHALPSAYAVQVLPMSKAVEVKAAFGNMIFQHYAGNGFDIWFSNYFIQHKTELIGAGNIPVLELHIQFMNEFVNTWDGIGEKTLRSYQYNLSYTPFLNNKASFGAGKPYHTFDIHFDVSYLQRLSEHFPALDRFLALVEKKVATDISEIDRFLTPETVAIVNQMIKCPFKNGVAAHYIEAKVTELLLLILDHVSQKHPLAPIKLSDYDIECLHEVKDLVAKNFENPLSIMQLAKKAGINDFKLKKGFKYLFGTTVFDYLQSIRMEKAKKLLLETELTIEQIAYTIGYEFPNNFTPAFKKQFGCTPADFRRLNGK